MTKAKADLRSPHQSCRFDLNGDHHAHKRFPERLAFLLDNPIRRWLSPPERLISKLKIGPGDVVVDFGCGPGFYLIPLARIAGKTIGIDASSRMLERAAKQAKKAMATVEVIQSDGTDIKLPDNCVDLILLVHVFHEVESKATVLKEFRRILESEGRLAVVEKTHRDRLSPKAFNPPTVSEKEVVREIQEGGFRLQHVILMGKDSIFMCAR